MSSFFEIQSLRYRNMLPLFELEYTFDDPDDPATVTVFPSDGGDITTSWITIDVAHTVDLSDVQ